jgi:putative nucleotidyltransferase with HDIG domain
MSSAPGPKARRPIPAAVQRSFEKNPVTKMSIPDIATCVRLMDQYRMLDNIRHHSIVVARVADVLFSGLQNKSGLSPVVDVDRRLIIAGSLLHDIAKTPCLDGSCDHAAFGAEICERHGYLEIAGIVKEHVILREHDPVRYENGLFTAREIVYYADKRVRHAQIVSLEQRLEYIINHYGNNDPNRHTLIRENFDRCLQMEEAMFAFLPFAPIELEYYVRFPQTPDEKER